MNVKCPSCGKDVTAKGELVSGQKLQCPSCKKDFTYQGEAVKADVPKVQQAEMTSTEPAKDEQSASSGKDDKIIQDAIKKVDETLKKGLEKKEGIPAVKQKIPSGKIYEDSVSLYDDEARVAFEYFRKAAERIVAEEDAVKAKQNKIEEDVVKAKKRLDAVQAEYATALNDAKKAKLWFIGFFLIIPIFIAISKLLDAKKRRIAAEEQQKIANSRIASAEEALENAKEEFKNIKRDYTISKLGIAYVPIATEVPFENKSFILDDTKKTANSTFELNQIKKLDEFAETLSELKERGKSVPVAETGTSSEQIPAKELVPSFDSVWMNDYLGSMDRDLRSISYFLRDLKKTSVTLPIIAPNGDYAKFLDEYCTLDTGDMPVLNVFNNTSYSEDLKKFEEINEMRKKMTFSNEKIDDVLKDFISEIAESVHYVGRAKIASIAKVLSSCGDTLLNSFKASYNHYSPEVAKEEIERLEQEDFSYRSNDTTGIKPFILSSGSRVRYDAISMNWVADDGARVSAPLGIHQIQEEIISPLVQNLLRETRIERLKIYNNIVDQKLNYVKEWQKEVDDFYGRGRAEGNDIINQIQVVLGEFTTAYSQYEAFRKTEESIVGGDKNAAQNMQLAEGTTEKNVLAFKEQADLIDAQKEDFNKYVEALQIDIERRAGEFSYTEDYEATLRDRHSKEAVMSLKAVDKLDDRRKVLLAANPYIAENAQLPPEALVNKEELYGRLGRDLRAMATTLVDDISPTIKVENVSKDDKKGNAEENSKAIEKSDKAPENGEKQQAETEKKKSDAQSDGLKKNTAENAKNGAVLKQGTVPGSVPANGNGTKNENSGGKPLNMLKGMGKKSEEKSEPKEGKESKR